MPTVFIYHEVKDKDHWLASPKREEFLGPLGVTNIRLFVDPENPTRASALPMPLAVNSALSCSTIPAARSMPSTEPSGPTATSAG